MFTVVGVHDNPADLVDLRVEFLLPVQQVPVSGLLDGGDHVVADVPLVTHPVPRIHGQEHTGLLQAVRSYSETAALIRSKVSGRSAYSSLSFCSSTAAWMSASMRLRSL